jgi:pimeloyl-ACP methyl ester carboxylesterase
VHAIDLPGFGRSTGPRHALSIPELASSIEGWMAAAGVERAHIVGNSMACQVIAQLAVKHPERIATVTMIGATIDPAAHRLSSQLFRLIRDAIHEPARLWVNWTVDFLRAGAPRALATTRHMFRDRITEQLPRITAPTLVIRGGKDPTMPQRWSEQANEMLQKGSCAVIEEEAHCAHYTVPGTIARLVTNHAASAHDPASAAACLSP